MRVGFGTENKTKMGNGFPRLQIEKDEYARIAVLDEPTVVYVHNITQPVVDPATGEIMKEERKRGNGETFEVDRFEFVAGYVCDGDVSVVREKEYDADNCALCRAVAEHTDKFKAPGSYYLSPVIKYKLQANSNQPQSPFSAELLLWKMSPRKFDKLIDLHSEFGDVRKIDLLLSECTNKTFQNFTISAGSDCYWLKSEESQKFVQGLCVSMPDEDGIRDAAGRPQTELSVKSDIEKVLERWKMVGRPMGAQALSGEFGQAAMSSQSAASSAEGTWGSGQQPAQGGSPDFLDGLTGGGQQETPAAPQEVQEPTPEQPSAETPAAPQEPAQEQPKEGGKSMSFDDILAGLN